MYLNALQRLELTAEQKDKGRISKLSAISRQLIQAHLDGYQPRMSLHLATALKRYLKSRPKHVRKSPAFVDEIRRKILTLHEYNLQIAKERLKYPRSEQLDAVLVEYVNLECGLLYSSGKQVNSELENNVTKRVLRLLRIIFYDAFRSSDIPLKASVDAADKALLNLIAGVRADYDLENKLLTTIILELVKKLNLLDEINKWKDKNIPLDEDTFLRDPQISSIRPNLTGCDYKLYIDDESDDEMDDLPVDFEKMFNFSHPRKKEYAPPTGHENAPSDRDLSYFPRDVTDSVNGSRGIRADKIVRACNSEGNRKEKAVVPECVSKSTTPDSGQTNIDSPEQNNNSKTDDLDVIEILDDDDDDFMTGTLTLLPSDEIKTENNEENEPPNFLLPTSENNNQDHSKFDKNTNNSNSAGLGELKGKSGDQSVREVEDVIEISDLDDEVEDGGGNNPLEKVQVKVETIEHDSTSDIETASTVASCTAEATSPTVEITEQHAMIGTVEDFNDDTAESLNVEISYAMAEIVEVCENRDEAVVERVEVLRGESRKTELSSVLTSLVNVPPVGVQEDALKETDIKQSRHQVSECGKAETSTSESESIFSPVKTVGSDEFTTEEPVGCDLATLAFVASNRETLAVSDKETPVVATKSTDALDLTIKKKARVSRVKARESLPRAVKRDKIEIKNASPAHVSGSAIDLPFEFSSLDNSELPQRTSSVYLPSLLETITTSEESNDSGENSLFIDIVEPREPFEKSVFNEETICDNLQFVNVDDSAEDKAAVCISIRDTDINFHILKQMEEFVGMSDTSKTELHTNEVPASEKSGNQSPDKKQPKKTDTRSRSKAGESSKVKSRSPRKAEDQQRKNKTSKPESEPDEPVKSEDTNQMKSDDTKSPKKNKSKVETRCTLREEANDNDETIKKKEPVLRSKSNYSVDSNDGKSQSKNKSRDGQLREQPKRKRGRPSQSRSSLEDFKQDSFKLKTEDVVESSGDNANLESVSANDKEVAKEVSASTAAEDNSVEVDQNQSLPESKNTDILGPPLEDQIGNQHDSDSPNLEATKNTEKLVEEPSTKSEALDDHMDKSGLKPSAEPSKNIDDLTETLPTENVTENVIDNPTTDSTQQEMASDSTPSVEPPIADETPGVEERTKSTDETSIVEEITNAAQETPIVAEVMDVDEPPAKSKAFNDKIKNEEEHSLAPNAELVKNVENLIGKTPGDNVLLESESTADLVPGAQENNINLSEEAPCNLVDNKPLEGVLNKDDSDLHPSVEENLKIEDLSHQQELPAHIEATDNEVNNKDSSDLPPSVEPSKTMENIIGEEFIENKPVEDEVNDKNVSDSAPNLVQNVPEDPEVDENGCGLIPIPSQSQVLAEDKLDRMEAKIDADLTPNSETATSIVTDENSINDSLDDAEKKDQDLKLSQTTDHSIDNILNKGSLCVLSSVEEESVVECESVDELIPAILVKATPQNQGEEEAILKGVILEGPNLISEMSFDETPMSPSLQVDKPNEKTFRTKAALKSYDGNEYFRKNKSEMTVESKVDVRSKLRSKSVEQVAEQITRSSSLSLDQSTISVDSSYESYDSSSELDKSKELDKYELRASIIEEEERILPVETDVKKSTKDPQLVTTENSQEIKVPPPDLDTANVECVDMDLDEDAVKSSIIEEYVPLPEINVGVAYARNNITEPAFAKNQNKHPDEQKGKSLENTIQKMKAKKESIKKNDVSQNQSREKEDTHLPSKDIVHEQSKENDNVKQSRDTEIAQQELRTKNNVQKQTVSQKAEGEAASTERKHTRKSNEDVRKDKRGRSKSPSKSRSLDRRSDSSANKQYKSSESRGSRDKSNSSNERSSVSDKSRRYEHDKTPDKKTEKSQTRSDDSRSVNKGRVDEKHELKRSRTREERSRDARKEEKSDNKQEGSSKSKSKTNEKYDDKKTRERSKYRDRSPKEHHKSRRSRSKEKTEHKTKIIKLDVECDAKLHNESPKKDAEKVPAKGKINVINQIIIPANLSDVPLNNNVEGGEKVDEQVKCTDISDSTEGEVCVQKPVGDESTTVADDCMKVGAASEDHVKESVVIPANGEEEALPMDVPCLAPVYVDNSFISPPGNIQMLPSVDSNVKNISVSEADHLLTTPLPARKITVADSVQNAQSGVEVLFKNLDNSPVKLPFASKQSLDFIPSSDGITEIGSLETRTDSFIGEEPPNNKPTSSFVKRMKWVVDKEPEHNYSDPLLSGNSEDKTLLTRGISTTDTAEEFALEVPNFDMPYNFIEDGPLVDLDFLYKKEFGDSIPQLQDNIKQLHVLADISQNNQPKSASVESSDSNFVPTDCSRDFGTEYAVSGLTRLISEITPNIDNMNIMEPHVPITVHPNENNQEDSDVPPPPESGSKKVESVERCSTSSTKDANNGHSEEHSKSTRDQSDKTDKGDSTAASPSRASGSKKVVVESVEQCPTSSSEKHSKPPQEQPEKDQRKQKSKLVSAFLESIKTVKLMEANKGKNSKTKNDLEPYTARKHSKTPVIPPPKKKNTSTVSHQPATSPRVVPEAGRIRVKKDLLQPLEPRNTSLDFIHEQEQSVGSEIVLPFSNLSPPPIGQEGSAGSSGSQQRPGNVLPELETERGPKRTRDSSDPVIGNKKRKKNDELSTKDGKPDYNAIFDSLKQSSTSATRDSRHTNGNAQKRHPPEPSRINHPQTRGRRIMQACNSYSSNSDPCTLRDHSNAVPTTERRMSVEHGFHQPDAARESEDWILKFQRRIGSEYYPDAPDVFPQRN